MDIQDTVGKRFLIMDLGASGGILAAHLAAAGHTVHGLDAWDVHREMILREGLRVTGQVSLTVPIPVMVAEAAELRRKDYDYVVIAGKTTRLPWAVETLRQLTGDFRIMAYQNGVDNEEFLARHFERARIFRAAINYGGILKGPGRVDMTFFHKPSYLGCLCAKGVCSAAVTLAELLTKAGLDTEATGNIKSHTWNKNMLNAAMSPVSAILGMTMAEVMRNQNTLGLVKVLLEESLAVGKASGLEFGENFLQECLDFLFKAGDHKPSMLIDIERGRPTEIDFINGQIVSRSHLHDVPAPTHSTILALVKAKE